MGASPSFCEAADNICRACLLVIGFEAAWNREERAGRGSDPSSPAVVNVASLEEGVTSGRHLELDNKSKKVHRASQDAAGGEKASGGPEARAAAAATGPDGETVSAAAPAATSRGHPSASRPAAGPAAAAAAAASLQCGSIRSLRVIREIPRRLPDPPAASEPPPHLPRCSALPPFEPAKHLSHFQEFLDSNWASKGATPTVRSVTEYLSYLYPYVACVPPALPTTVSRPCACPLLLLGPFWAGPRPKPLKVRDHLSPMMSGCLIETVMYSLCIMLISCVLPHHVLHPSHPWGRERGGGGGGETDRQIDRQIEQRDRQTDRDIW